MAARLEENIVYFMCVNEGKKLRVRVTTPSYNSNANCQFPRNIREDGGVYSAPSSAVRFGRGPAGKFFYRVSAKFVTKIQEKKDKIIINKIYENDDIECIVCMDNPHDVIIVPCGHYCMCLNCASKIKSSSGSSCPMCRGNIESIVTIDEIQE